MFFVHTIKDWWFSRTYRKEHEFDRIKDVENRLDIIEKLLKMRPARTTSTHYFSVIWSFDSRRAYTADLGKGEIRTLITGEESRLIDGPDPEKDNEDGED